MRNFIIFFSGKQGTTPLVKLLNNFEQISIVRSNEDRAWEPFDIHNCGQMSNRRLRMCLDLIFSSDPVDMQRLNQVYMKSAKRPLELIDKSKSVGFKMRYVPKEILSIMGRYPKIHDLIENNYVKIFKNKPFKKMAFNIVKKHKIVVFIAVRQDIFRWGLSKYHGDGTGKDGPLQFKVASGEINHKEIPKIYVDCNLLEKKIENCQKKLNEAKLLCKNLKEAGIDVYPLLYEDFLEDKVKYFKNLFNIIQVPITNQQICNAIEKGTQFKKVHSNDISTFVINHKEVMDKYQDKYIHWS